MTDLAPQKILFFNTNFYRKLDNPNYIKDCLNQLQNFYKHDIAVVPFFFDNFEERRCLMVVVKVANCQVDLFDRDGEADSKLK